MKIKIPPVEDKQNSTFEFLCLGIVLLEMMEKDQ
jgi:hypothetical protein